jgi:hypothetical protein
MHSHGGLASRARQLHPARAQLHPASSHSCDAWWSCTLPQLHPAPSHPPAPCTSCEGAEGHDGHSSSAAIHPSGQPSKRGSRPTPGALRQPTDTASPHAPCPMLAAGQTSTNAYTYVCGFGVFHAGVVVYGVEYAYGGAKAKVESGNRGIGESGPESHHAPCRATARATSRRSAYLSPPGAGSLTLHPASASA